MGKLKRKSDVYSFGVVLFEILCGRFGYHPMYLKKSDYGLAYVARQRFSTGTLKKMIDPAIKGEPDENTSILERGPNKDSFETFCQIAYRCVVETQDQRPTMKVVLKELEKALYFQETNKESLRMSLEDVKLATQNFHDDNYIGGEGTFWKVYKETVKKSERFSSIVAKRLDKRLGQEGEQLFWNELQFLFEYKHDSIIDLAGYCNEKDEKIIAYESVSRGSLDRYLDNASLTWKKRLNICIDIASALDFLHEGVGKEGKVIIHRDIKSGNILLNDDWEAKLAGFGFSLISPTNHETTDPVNAYVCGTSGYFNFDRNFKESDIFLFGLVLFEILCGIPALTAHKHVGHFLLKFIKSFFGEGKLEELLVFEPIKRDIVPNSLTIFNRIIRQCLHFKREKRPTAKQILIQLKKAKEFEDVNDYIFTIIEKPQLPREISGKVEHLIRVRLSDIISATDNFSETYRIAFETHYALYRAKLYHFDKESPSFGENQHHNEHSTVLIRRYPSGEELFFTEIEMLTSVKHHNIVTLHGFCVEASEMILIIDNVSNGYLGEYLENAKDKRLLTWEKRLNICIDVANALNYLHYEKMIIHRDINSYNVGLDEKWGAKITECGLSLFLPTNQEDEALCLSTIRGRSSYTDPEYKKTGKLKRESDVYSFGVFLFEILCGRLTYDPPYCKERDKDLASMARRSYRMRTLEEMIDPILKEETGENSFLLDIGPNKDSLHTFIEIAYQCVAETQDQRPTMKVVLKELEKALLLQKNEKNNPRISLEYVKLGTKNFHENNRIGGGGFGNVYKGNLQDGDRVITIVAKRLDTKFGQGQKEFLTELQILLEYKHENVVGLIGYCDEQNEKIIVYEYVSRGSLDRYLDDASLTWMKRLTICIEVASALDFLHGGVGKQAKVIHRDIKTANILLNHDWKAKLADFGLSLISPITQETNYVIDHVCGTLGYVDPQYKKSGFLTLESDIYSFGVVLFEILYGRSMYDVYKHEGRYLADFIKNIFEEGRQDEVVFGQIKEQIVSKSLTIFQEIAYKCIHHARDKCPTAKEVLIELKKALKFQILKGD